MGIRAPRGAPKKGQTFLAASSEITGGDTPTPSAASESKAASCRSAAGSSDIMFIAAVSIAAAGFVLLKKRKAKENE